LAGDILNALPLQWSNFNQSGWGHNQIKILGFSQNILIAVPLHSFNFYGWN